MERLAQGRLVAPKIASDRVAGRRLRDAPPVNGVLDLFSMSHQETDMIKIPRALFDRFTEALCYAA
jgi:hypothetical protein